MHECTASFLLYRFLQYMCWERGYDKDKLRKVIGSWKKHNGGRYIGDVPQAIPHTGHRSRQRRLNITVRRSRQSGVARATCPD